MVQIGPECEFFPAEARKIDTNCREQYPYSIMYPDTVPG